MTKDYAAKFSNDRLLQIHDELQVNSYEQISGVDFGGAVHELF